MGPWGAELTLRGVYPLPGGHPGELRRPVQREALQHLQGVRHLRGTGPLGQQGEQWLVDGETPLPPARKQEGNGLCGVGLGSVFHQSNCCSFMGQ